jgi:hypothetical protein
VRVCAGVAMLVVSLPYAAHAQPRATIIPGERQWVVGGWWRQAQGLPQDRVIALQQTRDGYMWVGTRSGVARFDGVRFAVWDGGTVAAPPEGEVFALVEPPDGGLWLGVYGGGLTRFKNDRFTALTTRDGLVDDYVRSLAIAGDGAVWIGTERGLSRYRKGKFTSFQVKDGLADDSVRVVFADAADDGVFVGTSRGLQHLVDNRFENLVLSSHQQDMQVDAITRDHAHRLWVGSSVGLFRWDGKTITAFGRADGLSSQAVRSVYEDSAGRIWVATNKGLDCAEPSSGSALAFVSVVTDADVTAVVEDREHSMWVGYRGHGLARLQRSVFRVFDATTGLPASSSTTVFQTHDGTMWTGAGTALSAIRGTHVDNFSVESGLPDRAVSSLSEDAAHHLWVGTEAGLFRSDAPIRCGPARCEARFMPVSGHPALRTHVRVLRPDGDATMLVGTNADGVISVHRAGASAVASVQVPGEVRAIVRESPDRLWIGLRTGGLVLLTTTGASTFTTREGLAHDNVQTLFLDRDGSLWIGTRRGLSWMQDGRLVSVTSAQGLPENHVYGITDDRDGRLWLSSGSGVFSVAKRELHEYAAGTRSRIGPVVYGLEQGLPSTLCALSHDPVITTDASGHVWVATLGGLAEIDPDVQRASPVPPPVHLESITVGQEVFSPDSPVETQHGRGTLVFRFAAPSFLAPDHIVFRYRLEGFDASWFEGGSSREARFTNIPPGRYRFTVLARGDGPVWNDTGASAEVYLIPHFYQRWWFSVLVSAVIAGMGIGFGVSLHRVRVRRLKARERELAGRVDEAVGRIKVLSGLLPVCAWCRRVRDDSGYWSQIETYVREHSQAEFSHSLCPDCLRKHFPDDADSLDKPAGSCSST